MLKSNAAKISRAAKKPGTEFLKNGVFAAVLSLAFMTVLLALFALIISKISIPFTVHQTVTSVLAAVAALLGAFIVARRRKSNGFLLGILTGSILFIALTALMLIFGDRTFNAQTAIKLLILLSSGAIGGLWGVARANTTKKVKVKI